MLFGAEMRSCMTGELEEAALQKDPEAEQQLAKRMASRSRLLGSCIGLSSTRGLRLQGEACAAPQQLDCASIAL